MRLRAWRDTWMWLAVGACGAPGWMTKSGTPKVSIFDAPPLAGATYVVVVERGDFGNPTLHLANEHGRYRCSPLVELIGNDRMSENRELEIALAAKTCDRQIAAQLLQNEGVFIVDAQGPRWVSAQDAIAAARPIDTPAKALLVVWLAGPYNLTWSGDKHDYGSPEDGRVRKVGGGFEVAASSEHTDSGCGNAVARETVTYYRNTLFVDVNGTIHEREKVATQSYDVADPCHPMGRRPTDFVDVASGGTVHGYFVRALHHEAESVRAFERIARELRAHRAPEELWRAAEQAAHEERDHAERCAQLAGVPVAIASDELPVRSLIELAIDNACEGCVGESYAALEAVVQAQAAAPELRAHFAAIAVDEVAHAALAHAIAEWLDTQLCTGERQRVQAARARALEQLAGSLDGGSPPELGLPSGAVAITLLDAVASLGTS